jgi:subtilisin family serine protease
LLPAATASAAGPAGSALSKHDRELLAEARVNGESTVTLLVAAGTGKNAKAASAITALGGKVGYREDSIDYLRVSIAIGKVEAVASLPSVQGVDVDEVIPLEDPRPDGVVGVIPQPAPGAGTPNANPYMPIADIGASQFMAANPTWDGRGVTIGIVDTGITLDHPSLQTTSTGERKIVDWVTATDPFVDNDPTWLDMAAQVSGSASGWCKTSPRSSGTTSSATRSTS